MGDDPWGYPDPKDRRYPRSGSNTERWRKIDRGEGCFVCGIRCILILHLHHIVPASDGGYVTRDNTTLLCANCHALSEQMRRFSKRVDPAGLVEAFHFNCMHLTDAEYERLVQVTLPKVEMK